jgi:hypothetical protein
MPEPEAQVPVRCQILCHYEYVLVMSGLSTGDFKRIRILCWLGVGVGHAVRHPNTSMRCSTTAVGTSEFRYDSALPNYPAQKHSCLFVSIRVPKPEPPKTKPSANSETRSAEVFYNGKSELACSATTM